MRDFLISNWLGVPDPKKILQKFQITHRRLNGITLDLDQLVWTLPSIGKVFPPHFRNLHFPKVDRLDL